MNYLSAVQAELLAAGIDAWLVYDFRGSNPVARPILGPLLECNIASRRVFLKIPARGTPALLVHAIEIGTLKPDLGVDARSYSSRQSLERITALRHRCLIAVDLPLLSVRLPALCLRLVTRADFALARAGGVPLPGEGSHHPLHRRQGHRPFLFQ